MFIEPKGSFGRTLDNIFTKLGFFEGDRHAATNLREGSTDRTTQKHQGFLDLCIIESTIFLTLQADQDILSHVSMFRKTLQMFLNNLIFAP